MLYFIYCPNLTGQHGRMRPQKRHHGNPVAQALANTIEKEARKTMEAMKYREKAELHLIVETYLLLRSVNCWGRESFRWFMPLTLFTLVHPIQQQKKMAQRFLSSNLAVAPGKPTTTAKPLGRHLIL